MDDFSQHPKTVGEIRLERDGASRSWMPRDALISLLREIDSGERPVTECVVVFRYTDPADGEVVTGFNAATRDRLTTLGLLTRAQFMIHGV